MSLKEWIKEDYGKRAVNFLLGYFGITILSSIIFYLLEITKILSLASSTKIAYIVGTLNLIILSCAFILSIISLIKQKFSWKALIVLIISILIILPALFMLIMSTGMSPV